MTQHQTPHYFLLAIIHMIIYDIYIYIYIYIYVPRAGTRTLAGIRAGSRASGMRPWPVDIGPYRKVLEASHIQQDGIRLCDPD